MDQFDKDEYECFSCKQRFRSALFSISREWNRVNYAGDEPEVEIQGSEGLECYCSEVCATSRRDLVMARESVPTSHPGIGPIESCSRCGAPVDMTEFHMTYLESHEVHLNAITLDTISLDYLAVLCRRCQPLRSEYIHVREAVEVEQTE